LRRVLDFEGFARLMHGRIRRCSSGSVRDPDVTLFNAIVRPTKEKAAHEHQ
jgi:hypothetical protein